MSDQVTHPTNDELTALLDESLPATQREQIEQHLESCPQCRETLSLQGGEDRWWKAATDLLVQTPRANEPRRSATDLRELETVLAPTDDPRMLGRIGPYEIAGIVGSGGMGIVLKGLDPALNRYVAIKILRPSQAGTVQAQRRFEREGRAAAAIVHENVIAIHSVAQAGSIPYLVMPYIRGESLQARITRNGALRVTEMLRVGYQVAAGLDAAHAQGLVHRDVKPSNILLDEGVERLKLTDFGLVHALDEAGITRTGTLAGTPEFMSPEQAMGKPMDARSDLFSLGVLFWTMSTGRPPFTADSCYGVIKAIVDTEPPSLRSIDPSLPPWWEALVAKLMSKRPEDRYDSAADVASTLQACLAHSQDASIPLPTEFAQPRRRRSWIAVLVGMTAIVLPTLGMLAAYPPSRRSSQDSVEKGAPAPTTDRQPQPMPLNIDWDDGTEQQLERIRNRLQRIEGDLLAP